MTLIPSILAESWAFLSLGFVIGMAHALEADHLAAVGAMMDGRKSRRSLALRGAVWGLGHTASLFVICSAAVVLGLTITGRAEAALECAVGVMIAGLGLRLLWKLQRERIHAHVHDHGDGAHIHLHSHAPTEGGAGDHAHVHVRQHLPALLVGLVHGAAGSAGLLVLTLAATDGIGEALAYFAVFGIGSVLGMATLTAVASLPLAAIERGAGWMKTATALTLGGLALWVGGSLALASIGGLL